MNNKGEIYSGFLLSRDFDLNQDTTDISLHLKPSSLPAYLNEVPSDIPPSDI